MVIVCSVLFRGKYSAWVGAWLGGWMDKDEHCTYVHENLINQASQNCMGKSGNIEFSKVVYCGKPDLASNSGFKFWILSP